MQKLIAILGVVAVVAGPAAVVAEQIDPEVGAVLAGAGAVALATTKAIVDVSGKLAARTEKKSRQRAARR